MGTTTHSGPIRSEKGFQVRTGTADATAGRNTLVAGTVTVNTTAITANSIVLLTRNVAGGTVGDLSIGTRVAGTSFVINSANSLDTSSIGWMIIEPFTPAYA